MKLTPNLLSKVCCIVVCLGSILLTANQSQDTTVIFIYACLLNIPAMLVVFPDMLFPADKQADDQPDNSSIPATSYYAWAVILVLLILNHLVR